MAVAQVSRFRLPLRRPSRALLVATVALVTSVAGNAAAAVIISSNHQIAAHTISGADAPTGDNANLIAGSIGSADLHNGAITRSKLAPDARANRLQFTSVGIGIFDANLLTLDELKIRLECDGTNQENELHLYLTSSVDADINWSYIDRNDSTTVAQADGEAISANAVNQPFGITQSWGPVHRLEGQLIYANSKRVISIAFHIVLLHNLNNLCEVTGTAVPAV